MNTLIIAKEKINQLHFSNKEVLESSEMKIMRFNLLKQGEALGNTYKHKVKIFFQSIEGSWMVYATVWLATETHVQLKGGILIPIKVIEEVTLFGNF